MSDICFSKAAMISHGNLEFAFRQAMVVQEHRLAVAKVRYSFVSLFFGALMSMDFSPHRQ
jgi:hypothetical protein